MTPARLHQLGMAAAIAATNCIDKNSGLGAEEIGLAASMAYRSATEGNGPVYDFNFVPLFVISVFVTGVLIGWLMFTLFHPF